MQGHLDLQQTIMCAIQAAQSAGKYLRHTLGTARIAARKTSHDDLLDSDMQAEAILLNELQQLTPSIGILSEESGQWGNQEVSWVIDPLDGSANYQCGNPLFAISIALIQQQKTVAGVIYLPVADELFTAIKGKGAFLNGQEIHVSSISVLERAIVLAGDVSKEGNQERAQQRLRNVFLLGSHARRLRMLGSAAIDLAYLACGRADVLLNYAPEQWDIAAGALLVEEAGGSLSHKKDQWDDEQYLFSNPHLHTELKILLGD